MNQAKINLRSLPKQIGDRLNELRRRLTMWVLVKGLSRWLLLVLAIVAFDVLLDRMFKMDLPQRAIMLVVMVSAVTGLLYWRVIQPLLKRISDDALLHEIEAKYPELNENLISGAQLARQPNLEDKGVSAELATATIEKSIEFARKMDFGETINRRKLLKNSVVLSFGSLVVLAIAIGVFQSEFLSTWFNRNVLLGDAQWPQATYLEIVGADENGMLVLPRGTDHRLLVRITEDSRVQDVDVFLEIESSNGQVSHQMKPTGKLDGREHLFLMHNVSSESKLRASGGDDQTPTVTIQLVEPPAIMDLDMWAVLPEYTQAEKQLLVGPGPHSVLAGSRIEGTATVNKRLNEFKLANARQEFELLAEEQELSYRLNIPKDQVSGGQYAFKLIDETGLSATRPNKFAISIKDDAPPKILASLLGISGLAVPRARLPVSFNANDEYGLSRIWFHANWKNSDVGSNPDALGTRDLTIASFEQESEVARNVQDVSVMELEPFGFEPGTSLRLLIRVADTKPNPENTLDSVEFLIRIVSAEELRADLLRREIEQRKAFQRVYDAQLELSGEMQAIAAMTRSNESEKEFNANRESQMIDLSREQKLIGTSIDAIANRFEEFLVESQNNRLDEEQAEFERQNTLADRFDNFIIQPIRILDRDLIAIATRALDNCRVLLKNPTELQAAVDETVLLHQQILDEMRKIMDAMQESEDFQGIVNKLLDIKRGEDQINAELKRRTADEKEIFDEDDIFDDN